MPYYKHMIEHSHLGPLVTLLAGGAWASFAQAIPDPSAIDKWGPLTLCGIAIVWLVKELTKEREHNRQINEKFNEKISGVIDRSVEAQHQNKMATMENTTALRNLSEKIEELSERR